MLCSCLLCVVFIATASAIIADTYMYHENSSGNDIKDYKYGSKSTRAAGVGIRLAKQGLMAVKRLISDATVFPASRFPNPSDNLVRQFEKHGDYKKAVEDFYAIRPEDLRDFTMPSGAHGKTGLIGDRILYVKSSNDYTGMPSIEIFQIGDDLRNGKANKVKLTELITYSDKFVRDVD